MPDTTHNPKSHPTLANRRTVRKVLKIGHSWAITIPGDWVRRNVDPDNPHVRTAIDADGAYRIQSIRPAQPQT